MAAASTEPHTIVQSWVPVELAQELKANARAGGCSVSSLIRDALEDFAGSGEGAVPGGTLSSSFTRRGADAQREEE